MAIRIEASQRLATHVMADVSQKQAAKIVEQVFKKNGLIVKATSTEDGIHCAGKIRIGKIPYALYIERTENGKDFVFNLGSIPDFKEEIVRNMIDLPILEESKGTKRALSDIEKTRTQLETLSSKVKETADAADTFLENLHRTLAELSDHLIKSSTAK